MQIILIEAAAGLTAQGINTCHAHTAAPAHISRIKFRWMKIAVSMSLLQLWQVIVREMCAGDAAQAAGAKPANRNVSELNCKQSGIVLQQLCQSAAH